MKRLLIGLGNPFRSDDAAGLEVARRVRTVETHQRMTGSYELIDMWEDADEVIIVDATRSGVPAGTVRQFHPLLEPLPNRTFASTHAIGVAETIEMARRLERLPTQMVVYGIEARDVTAGTTMSPPVEEAVMRTAKGIDDA
jgi:hydrogenase maturation protease